MYDSKITQHSSRQWSIIRAPCRAAHRSYRRRWALDLYHQRYLAVPTHNNTPTRICATWIIIISLRTWHKHAYRIDRLNKPCAAIHPSRYLEHNTRRIRDSLKNDPVCAAHVLPFLHKEHDRFRHSSSIYLLLDKYFVLFCFFRPSHTDFFFRRGARNRKYCSNIITRNTKAKKAWQTPNQKNTQTHTHQNTALSVDTTSVRLLLPKNGPSMTSTWQTTTIIDCIISCLLLYV